MRTTAFRMSDMEIEAVASYIAVSTHPIALGC